MTGRPVLSLLLPTRGRPALAQRFLLSLYHTAQHPEDIEVVMYVDEDDLESHKLGHEKIDIQLIIGPRLSMGGYNSACFERSRGDVIVLVNDDVVIRTPGWDERIRRQHAAVPDGIYLAYGNDQFKKRSLCTFPILSRRACEILQEPYHRAYRGAFIDYHLMDIFKRLERAGYHRIIYLPELVFEHLHYRTGKADKDATYTARGRFDDDLLFVGLAAVRAASLALLVGCITGAATLPKTLPAYTPLRQPAGLTAALWMFTRTFLMDGGLPANWRFFMWWWFAARYMASRVL